jgi:hypothetical protein
LTSPEITLERIKSIETIYLNIYYSFYDHDYFNNHGLNVDKLVMIDLNRRFIFRLKQYLFRFTIVECFKLFGKKENYQIAKFLNYEIRNSTGEYKKSLIVIKNCSKSPSFKKTVDYITTLRTKHFAHLDINVDDSGDTLITIDDFKKILDYVFDFLVIVYKFKFKKNFQLDNSHEAFGHKLHLEKYKKN